MKVKDLFIIGHGEQGKIIEVIAEQSKNYSTIKFVDDRQHKFKILDLLKIKNEDKKKILLFIAIGDNKIREKIYLVIAKMSFSFTTIIDPSAIIDKSVKIGENVFIGKRAIINSYTEIGKGVYINTGSIIEHDNKIGDFSHMASGTITGGGVKFGKKNFVGLGSIINDHIEIGNNVIVGSGSIVTKSYKQDNITLIGRPAKIKL